MHPECEFGLFFPLRRAARLMVFRFEVAQSLSLRQLQTTLRTKEVCGTSVVSLLDLLLRCNVYVPAAVAIFPTVCTCH